MSLHPEKFNSKTNGITQRRWLVLANRRLADLIADYIGNDFVTDLYQLKQLIPLAGDPEFQQKWRQVKHENKLDFTAWVRKHPGERIDPDSLFDFRSSGCMSTNGNF
jgi:starch phosphorylase